MNDNSDNVVNLFNKPSYVKEDAETHDSFMRGAAEYMAYQDGEEFSAACMNGILKALSKKIGLQHDGVHSDAAVIAVLIQGMFMRQVGIECPETNLLDDLREGLTVKRDDK